MSEAFRRRLLVAGVAAAAAFAAPFAVTAAVGGDEPAPAPARGEPFPSHSRAQPAPAGWAERTVEIRSLGVDAEIPRLNPVRPGNRQVSAPAPEALATAEPVASAEDEQPATPAAASRPTPQPAAPVSTPRPAAPAPAARPAPRSTPAPAPRPTPTRGGGGGFDSVESFDSTG